MYVLIINDALRAIYLKNKEGLNAGIPHFVNVNSL